MARRRRARLAHRRCLLLALTCSAVVLHGFAATAAAAPRASVVSTATTTPAAFVPDWDGHTDATVFEYQLERAGTVHVRVLNEAGYVVATIDSGARASGTHLVSWDGRGRDGTVQPPGTYRIRVDATPAAQQAGTAGIQADVAPGARAATVTLQQAPVAVTGVALSRPTVGRSGKAATTRALFKLSTAAAVSAAIVDGAGRSVATLATGRMTAGDHAVAWNGRTTAGAAANDGEYALVVAASGSGRPTGTTRVPLRVDRTLPRMRASKATRATASGADVSFPVTVVVSEPTAVTIALRSHVVRRGVPAGTTKLVLRGSQLGIARGRVAKTVRVRVAAADAAGNVVTTVSSVVVPAAARRPATTVPPKQPTTTTPPPPDTTTPPAAGGKLAWPIGGPVTSEFGMRGGRPHTGLDIADPTGTPIHPAGPGTVSFVGVYNGYGNIVIVDHPNGLQTYYAHMSRFGGFGVGAKVVHTDTIGYVGCTGHCTGPHVHFETRVGAEHVPKDPRLYLAPR